MIGVQQCIGGIDEDDCEELELNECEESEYRCIDGSCIPEQFWLDGQFDCPDQSDEQEILENRVYSNYCPLISSRFDCDEITVSWRSFACGDGQFAVYRSLTGKYCYNYRMAIFFCEHPWFSKDLSLWTRADGRCVDRVVMEKTFSDMNESEKCVFLLKCKLTQMTSVHCQYATDDFSTRCKDKKINYPVEPFFIPYAQTVYQLHASTLPSVPTYLHFNGTIKCIGYPAVYQRNETFVLWNDFIHNYPFEVFFCKNTTQTNIDGPQLSHNC
jgi:hypothetical protein